MNDPGEGNYALCQLKFNMQSNKRILRVNHSTLPVHISGENYEKGYITLCELQFVSYVLLLYFQI